MKRKTKIILISAISLAVILLAVILAITLLNKENKSNSPDADLEGTITLGEFVSDLMLAEQATTSQVAEYDEKNVIDIAFELGIIDEDDKGMVDLPILRQGAARIAHNVVNNILSEPDEENVDAAKAMTDLYSCRTCVIHVSQMYVKGIMNAREDNLFCGEETLTVAEAEDLIKKVYDASLREPKSSSMYLPEDTDTNSISPDEVLNIMATHDNVALVDVRSLEEYNTGFITGSVCIPLPEIQENLEATPIAGCEDWVIIVYCQMGSRSEEACRILKESGYTKVYNLGGIEDWPYDIVK